MKVSKKNSVLPRRDGGHAQDRIGKSREGLLWTGTGDGLLKPKSPP